MKLGEGAPNGSEEEQNGRQQVAPMPDVTPLLPPPPPDQPAGSISSSSNETFPESPSEEFSFTLTTPSINYGTPKRVPLP